ncbi:MAG: hypothetical protein V1792_28775, partial [Pseudomonadota bacterium]
SAGELAEYRAAVERVHAMREFWAHLKIEWEFCGTSEWTELHYDEGWAHHAYSAEQQGLTFDEERPEPTEEHHVKPVFRYRQH